VAGHFGGGRWASRVSESEQVEEEREKEKMDKYLSPPPATVIAVAQIRSLEFFFRVNSPPRPMQSVAHPHPKNMSKK